MNNIKSAMGKPFHNNFQEGTVLLALIVGMVLMGILTAGIISFTSTSQIQNANTKQGDSAYYLAEAGLRYAASQYKKTENDNANFDPFDLSADDEKAAFLENNLDAQTFTIPGNKGIIAVDVYPYWFVFADRNSDGNVTLKLPGHVPDDFALPASGRLKFGNEIDSPTYLDYTNGVVSADGVFTCDQFTNGDIDPSEYERKEAYPVLRPNTSQSNVENIVLRCTTPGMFPSRNGRIIIGADYFTYERTSFDSDNSLLTLIGLSQPATVTTDDNVVLKKFIVLESTGTVGTGGFTNSKTITNSIPIGDSNEESAPIDIRLDNTADFQQYFDKPNNEGSVVQKLWTAGGGTAIFTNMHSLAVSSDSGEDNEYKQGDFNFKVGLLDDAWEKEHILDYDLQIKLSSLNRLMYSCSGLEFRKKHVDTDADNVKLYQGFGVSLMKYYSPAVKFTGGTREVEDGDWIYYYGASGVDPASTTCDGALDHLFKAQVDGAPIITSGSWSTGDAAGILMLKNDSLETETIGENGGCYAVSGNSIVTKSNKLIAVVDQVLHRTQGYNDYIPNSIKPAGMGSWLGNSYYPPYHYPGWNDTNNEGDRLLLVLWQQKVKNQVEYRRLLAYKDMTHDYFLKGKQDYNDGRIVNDETSLLLRIREDYINTTKINKINIFYGDSSRLTHFTARTKNKYKYDILDRRMAYWGGFKLPDQSTPVGGWYALWPPRNLSYWTSSYDQFDYFSHIEKPAESDIPSDAPITDPDTFQWDYIASTTGEIDSWEGGGKAIFTLDDDGTITISDFTTPDSGTFNACEVGLGAFFNSASSILVGFSDFSIRVLDPGYAYGAFISSVQS